MTDIKANAWAICDRVAEAQAMLHDYLEGGRFAADEIVRKLAALMKEEGLLRAMWEVGYFPPDTPPPVMLAGNWPGSDFGSRMVCAGFRQDHLRRPGQTGSTRCSRTNATTQVSLARVVRWNE